MGKKRSAKARQREAERRRQLSQHGVKVMGSNGKPLRTKGGMKKKSSKGSLSLLEKQLGGANPFATKRNAGKSIKLRQRTLLRDYKSRNKSTVFADKRLGENNPGLDEEDRTLLRLARERARSFRDKDKFNLDLDGEEEDFGEVRDELLPSDDDEMFEADEAPLTAESIASMAQFGGLSKKANAEERIKQFEDDLAKKRAEIADPLEELKALDAEYTGIEQDVIKEGNEALKAGRIPSTAASGDFDSLVRSFQLLPRNPASDHIKTQEERDKQYQKKLEQLEKERIRRMADDGTTDPSAHDDDGGILDLDALIKARRTAGKGKAHSAKGKGEEELKVLSPEQELASLPLPELLRQHLLAIPSGAGKTDTLTRRYGLLWTALEKHISATNGTDLTPLNRAIRTLFEMTQSVPRPAAHWCRAWCQSLQRQLASKQNPNYPRLSTLIVLQVFPLLFPSTDFRHPVMTPAFLIMSCLLTTCSVATPRNIAAGLYVCTCYLEAVREAKRFVPEVVSFLTSTILLTSTKFSRAGCLPPFQRLPISKRNILELTSKPKHSEPAKLTLHLLQVGPAEAGVDEVDMKHTLIVTALRLLSSMLAIYSGYPAVYDAGACVVECLEDLAANSSCPSATKKLASRLAQKIKGGLREPREHLQLQKHRPVPLPELEPDFNPVFIDRKGAKLPKEERDLQRLKHQFKRERKGAIKEIRKDTAFLARVRLEEQRELDAERFQKVRQIENLMADSRREEKQMKRPKKN